VIGQANDKATVLVDTPPLICQEPRDLQILHGETPAPGQKVGSEDLL
jgi:hypothetical protein